MPHRRFVGLLIALLVAACASSPRAPAGAESVLRAAAENMGGVERLQTATTLSFAFSGHSYWLHQGLTPELPVQVRTTQRYHAELTAPRVYLSFENVSPTGAFRPALAMERGHPQLAEFSLRAPHLVLREALGHASELRVAETSPQSTILEGPLFGRNVRLHFSAEHRLIRAETPINDARRGDTVSIIEYLDYAARDGLVAPQRIRQSVGGATSFDASVDAYALDTARPDWSASLTPPPPPPANAPTPAPVQARTEMLAPGVHLVVGHVAPNNYASLVVELEDGLMLLETPTGDYTVMAAALARISSLPLRYAVPTHHHDDHSGGVAALAPDVTVLTTPNSVEFFREMSSAPRMITRSRPARPALNVRALANGERIGPVQFFNIGPHAHAQEHLTFYFPDYGILYQSDLVTFPNTDDPTREHACVLYNAIRRNNLRVSRIVGTHGQVGTMADLDALIAARTTPCPAA